MSPMDRRKYPADWPEISRRIRERAGWRCEHCGARHGEPHPDTGSRVILTVAHLDHDPANCDPANLRAWCQKCHLTYDARLHATHARLTRREQREERQRRAGQRTLFGERETGE